MKLEPRPWLLLLGIGLFAAGVMLVTLPVGLGPLLFHPLGPTLGMVLGATMWVVGWGCLGAGLKPAGSYRLGLVLGVAAYPVTGVACTAVVAASAGGSLVDLSPGEVLILAVSWPMFGLQSLGWCCGS